MQGPACHFVCQDSMQTCMLRPAPSQFYGVPARTVVNILHSLRPRVASGRVRHFATFPLFASALALFAHTHTCDISWHDDANLCRRCLHAIPGNAL